MTTHNSSKRQTLATAAALLIAIAIGQVWILTAGLQNWPHYSNCVARLAEAFLHRQLSLTVKPARDLLALPNPFDPAKNFNKVYYDALLFHEKYYFYWGPAPSIIAAGFCLPFRLAHPDFGDEYVAFVFLFGTVCLTAVLMFQIKARWFPKIGPFNVAAPILTLGLGSPAIYAVARPAMYETMIAAGQFFLLAGFCAILHGIERKRQKWVLAAGICWTLSIGSRVSLLPGLAAATAVALWQMRKIGWRKSMPALVTPLIGAVALLGWYNFARFHSFLEFGLRWQLAGLDQHDKPFSTFFSTAHVPANVFRYLFAEPEWVRGFPFLRAGRQTPWLEDRFNLSSTLHYDPLIGILWTMPFLLFALAARNRGEPKWIVGSLAGAAIFAFLPDLAFQWSAMRYLLDALPCCSVLAAVGYWNCLEPFGDRAARINWLAAALVTVQIAFGMLLGITGMYDNFQTYNPPLFNAMRSFFGG